MLVLGLGLALLLTDASADERVLFSAGKSDYEIVCSADANSATALAARELRLWIAESSGIELPLVTQPSPDRGHLFVGPNQWSSDAGVTTDGLKPEGYRLQTVGDDVHIVGVDVLRGSLQPRRASATQTGSLSGVGDFLERYLGVQFLWHDKLGTIVPKHDRVVVGDLDIETSPVWTYRYLAYSPENKCGDDLFGRRLRLGHSYTVTHSHAWYQIAPIEQYGAKHPEWYAEIGGERKPAYYMEHHGGQVCTTNEEVIELFAAAAIDFFNEQPERDMFSVSPNDGGGFCTCEKCRALDNGTRADGSLIITDRLITFYNNIAERVAEVHPNKLLGAYAYSYYREPPQKVRPHPNLYLVHATNTAFHQGTGWPEEHEMEKQWRSGAKHFTKYDIYYSPDTSLNLIAPVTRHLVEKIRAESAIGMQGGYLYMGQSYEQLGAGHLLLARLMWSPDADVEMLTDGYFHGLYGAAGPQVRSYYELLESRLVAARNAPLDTRVAAIRVALRKHPGLGSPAYLLSAYHPVLDEASQMIAAASACDLNSDESARLQRLIDQHELLVSTVRGMFVAARVETDARSTAIDARELLAFIEQREAVRERLKAYAPSLCENLIAGDHRETEALAPQGALAQLARVMLAPGGGTREVRTFSHGDIEKVEADRVAERCRWSGSGGATIELERAQPRAGKNSLRVSVPEGGTGTVTFTVGVKASTSYRVTVDHWNEPVALPVTAGDDADEVTRGAPPLAPRTRVSFRDDRGETTKRHWSGLGADEFVRQWHTFPHLIQTEAGTSTISFTLFLHHPGTYLLDEVKIEELGPAGP